jgi:hypothetical protein
MNDEAKQAAAPIPEVEATKAKLANTFGAPPPEAPVRPLTDEDKAAVARVSESPETATTTEGAEGEHVSSAVSDLETLTSNLAESDPEAAEIAEREAKKISDLS